MTTRSGSAGIRLAWGSALVLAFGSLAHPSPALGQSWQQRCVPPYNQTQFCKCCANPSGAGCYLIVKDCNNSSSSSSSSRGSATPSMPSFVPPSGGGSRAAGVGALLGLGLGIIGSMGSSGGSGGSGNDDDDDDRPGASYQPPPAPPPPPPVYVAPQSFAASGNPWAPGASSGGTTANPWAAGAPPQGRVQEAKLPPQGPWGAQTGSNANVAGNQRNGTLSSTGSDSPNPWAAAPPDNPSSTRDRTGSGGPASNPWGASASTDGECGAAGVDRMKARLTTIASGSAQMCVASRNMATAAIEAANFYKRCTATLDPDHANENEMLVIASQAQATARTSCVN